MAPVLQKCVCSGLLVLLCLSFSFAALLDHIGDDYRKLKATVIGEEVDSVNDGNGHGRGSSSRTGSRPRAAWNEHAPGNGISGGSGKSATLVVPLVENISTNEHEKMSKTTQGEHHLRRLGTGTPVVPIVKKKSTNGDNKMSKITQVGRHLGRLGTGTPVVPIVKNKSTNKDKTVSKITQAESYLGRLSTGTPVVPIVKNKSTNENKKMSKITEDGGGEIELNPRATTKTTEDERGEIEITRGEIKMARHDEEYEQAHQMGGDDSNN